MAIREVLKMGDPRLLASAEPVTTFTDPMLLALITDLHDTMQATKGAGLAAPQIGVPLQVVIFGTGTVLKRYPDAPPIPPTVLINPTFTPLGVDMEEGWEGCLSLPSLRGLVPRYNRIRYQGFNEHGDIIDRTVDGFHARVVQHECDHLWGVLFPMRMKDMAHFGFEHVLFPDEYSSDE